jgi:hypothetical protein
MKCRPWLSQISKWTNKSLKSVLPFKIGERARTMSRGIHLFVGQLYFAKMLACYHRACSSEKVGFLFISVLRCLVSAEWLRMREVMWYPIEQSLVFSSMFNVMKNLVTLFYPPASFFFSLLLLLCLLSCITSHKTCAGAKLRVFFSSKWQICIFNILKRPRIDSFLSRSWLKLQVDLIIEWLCCWDDTRSCFQLALSQIIEGRQVPSCCIGPCQKFWITVSKSIPSPGIKTWHVFLLAYRVRSTSSTDKWGRRAGFIRGH